MILFRKRKRGTDGHAALLALHHIIKNRGHFLLETNVSGERESFHQAIHTLQEYLQEQYELDLTLPNAEAFAQHLKDRKRSITAKKKILKEDAGLTKADGMQNAIVDLLAGAKVKLAVLFQDDTLKNAEPGSLPLSAQLCPALDVYMLPTNCCVLTHSHNSALL